MLNVGSIYTEEDIKIIDKIRPNKVLEVVPIFDGVDEE
jgi:hypothetical protein